MTDANRARGRFGEDLAARWYVDQGYEVLARNWRPTGTELGREVKGELDVIAARNGVLVICEVKARASNQFGSAAEAVTGAKQRKLRSLAMAWLRADGRHWREIRFDVAAVTGTVLEVIESAF